MSGAIKLNLDVMSLSLRCVSIFRYLSLTWPLISHFFGFFLLNILLLYTY